MRKHLIPQLGPLFLGIAFLIIGFALGNLENPVGPIPANGFFYASLVPFLIWVLIILHRAKQLRDTHTLPNGPESDTPSFESLTTEVQGSANTTVIGDDNTIIMVPPPAPTRDVSMASSHAIGDDGTQMPTPLTVPHSSDLNATDDDDFPSAPDRRSREHDVFSDRLKQTTLLIDSGQHNAAINTLVNLRAETSKKSMPAEFYASLANRLGAAYLRTDRLADAETELQAATRIIPNHLKAFTNLASLKLKNNDPDGALQITDGILDGLKQHPLIGAVRICALHQLQQVDKIDAFLARFPDTAATPTVKAALAAIRLADGKPEEALALAREVATVEPHDPIHKNLLGQSLLAAVAAEFETYTPVPWLMNPGIRGLVEEASAVLTGAVECLELRDEPGRLRSALLGRAHARMILQQFAEALGDCARARELGPDDDHLRQRMATILLLSGQPLEAENLLSAIEDQDVRKALLPQRASALIETLRTQEAIDLLRPVWDAASDDSLPVDIGSMLITAYDSLGNREEAVSVLRKLQSSRKTDRQVLEVSARFAARTGRTIDAENLFQDAMREADPNEKDWIALSYADFLSASGDFGRSVELYEGRVPIDRSSPYLRKYLIALWNADRLARLFDVTAGLRVAGVTEEIVNELHARCLIEAGDMEAAITIWRSLIDSSDSPSRFHLEAAVTAFRAGDQEQARQFVSRITISNLGNEPFALMQLAQLRHSLGMDDVVSYAYAAWRQAPRDAEIHGSYIQILLSREDAQSELSASSLPEVTTDSTVFLRCEQQEAVFTIHSRMPPNPTDEDILESNSTAERLLSRRVGDLIDFGAGRSFEITEIRSKYAVAGSRAMTGFENRFPENQSIQSFSVDPELSALRERVTARNELIDNVVDHYRGRTIPLATVAQATGTSVIEVWGGLTSRANEEILAWQGDADKSRDEIELVKQGVAVLDSTALLALATIGQFDTLRAVVPRLVVPQAVLDDFTDHYMLRYQGKKPVAHISSEGENLTYELFSEESWEHARSFIENIILFITRDTERVPCMSYLLIAPDRRRMLTDIIGKSSLVPILVSKELNAPLYSDDHMLRLLAQNEYEVRGIWSGAAMAAARDMGKIDSDIYSKSVSDLISFNYVNVPVSAPDLIWSFKDQGQQASDLFRRVAGHLGGPCCDDVSAVAVAAEATKLAWTTLTLVDRKRVLVDELIRALQIGRHGTSILKQYKQHLVAIASRPAMPESYWDEIDLLIKNRASPTDFRP